MKFTYNPICEKLGDHRVLGALALFLFLLPVALAVKDSHASGRSAPATRRGTVSSTGREVGRAHAGSFADPEITRGSLLEAKEALGLAREPPEKPGDAPGDFFADVSAAFGEGEASGLVRCRTAEEHDIFERWRDALGGRSLLESLDLHIVEQNADGIERYRISIAGGIEGSITFKRHRNRWYVIGVKETEREETEKEHDPELDRLLESLKIDRSAPEDLHGPEPEPPPEEEEAGTNTQPR